MSARVLPVSAPREAVIHQRDVAVLVAHLLTVHVAQCHLARVGAEVEREAGCVEGSVGRPFPLGIPHRDEDAPHAY